MTVVQSLNCWTAAAPVKLPEPCITIQLLAPEWSTSISLECIEPFLPRQVCLHVRIQLFSSAGRSASPRAKARIIIGYERARLPPWERASPRDMMICTETPRSWAAMNLCARYGESKFQVITRTWPPAGTFLSVLTILRWILPR